MFEFLSPVRWILLCLAGMMLVPPSCAHAPWSSSPVGPCKEVAALDQVAMEARGYELVQVESGKVFGDVEVIAGIFRRGETEAEVHLLAPPDLAVYLAGRGWSRLPDTTCVRHTGDVAELLRKPLPKNEIPPAGYPARRNEKDTGHGRDHDDSNRPAGHPARVLGPY